MGSRKSKSMTLDDLERPKRHTGRKKVYGSKWKNFTLSAARCRPMNLVSADIRGGLLGRGRQIHTVRAMPTSKL